VAGVRTHRLSVGTILLVVFVLVSSGPFGIEEMVSSTGPGLAVLLLLVTPIVWGVPLALICTELAAAIPAEGGSYVWVERGLGPFWAFQNGWWMTLSGLVDTALYAVLAATYLNSGLGGPPLARWLISVGVILLFATVNVRSFRSMALSTAAFAVVILAPCAVMTALGIAAWTSSPIEPFVPEGQAIGTSLGLGLAVAIWFYSGYESMSTMAGEVAEPQRVIPRALLLSIPFVVAVYLLPTLAGLASVGRWQEWSSESGVTLVDVASALGGPALGAAMLIAALVSNLALYNAYLASGARTTLVMAQDRLLPRPFGLVHGRFGTPHGSIVITAAIHALLAIGSFEVLLVIDVFLFVISYLLIFVSVVALRLKEPGLERPFRVPVGVRGLTLVAAVPAAVGLVALVAAGLPYWLAGGAAAATGPVAYALLRRPREGLRA